eukprot:CAMPEP_0184500712 /NCGR_PEP_ID=MMETSP0113_2-20130426/45579_1 /TAXON_ID=91329 /ORGANISM="Norrisiella sphaerica, Strain BC52" /LENGTH=387 /DNA_ID=CAMNT_0026889203 /DNA_START=133 /DNA_END=1296 /DNA_ORIENTATION=+
MGSLCSLILPKVDLHDVNIRDVQQRFKLTAHEMQVLQSKFNAIDRDKSGFVDFQAFFDFIQEPSKELLGMVFKLLTNLPEAEFDFPSWCTGVIGFCMLTPDEMIRVVYTLHDVDKNGFLDISEVTILLENMHRENAIYPSMLTTSIVQNYILGDGKLDFEEFQHACKTHPMLLWPIFRTQYRMRKNLLGQKFFDSIDRRLPETYTEDPTKKGGKRLTEFEALKELVDLYCCTFCGCYSSGKVIHCEVEAGEKVIAFQRALGEFDPDPELVQYQKELEEKRKRHEKALKEKKEDDANSSSNEESVIEEVVINKDGDDFGETDEHKAQMQKLRDLMNERKEKKRETRKQNPRYFNQDHFDSEWYDYSDEIRDLGDLSVEYDEHPDSRKV